MSNFQLFRNSVRATPSSRGGTQSDELQAKIKSVTSSTTVGAVFVYDTRNDSDGGAWRKKCAGLSWFDEDLNTANKRGGRREFPSKSLIVADGATPQNTIRIYDLDDPAMPMWMEFRKGAASWTTGNMGLTDNNVSSVFALNGRIYIGQAAGSALGVEEISFVEDAGYRYTTSATAGGYYNGNIAERLDSKGWAGSHSRGNIVNGIVNDVAATYLEGGELDSLGLVRPVAALATDGGVSVIHPNGDVYDLTSSSYASPKCAFDVDNSLFALYEIGSARRVHRFLLGQLYSDTAAGNNESIQNLTNTGWSGAGMALGLSQDAFSFAGKNKFALGGPSGLHLWKRAVGFDALNTAEPPNLNAYITSGYNTGYMLGDIRGAFLANTKGGDKSVKGNTLTENGSITGTKFNDDLYGYSGWSASNYLSRANDTDFDFGTGDFSIMFWCKSSTTGSTNDFIARGDVTPEAGDFFIRKNASEKIQLFRHTGTSYQTPISASSSSIGTSWSQVVVTRSGTTVSIYVNGKREVSGTWSDTFTPSGGSAFTIGLRLSDTSVTGQHMSLSLVRISATAPTPQQVKEIYEAERPLFRAGAKCLLAANQVNDLAYDSSTNLLHVASESTSSSKSFRGLEAVESLTSDGSFGLAASKPLDYVAASGGVVVGVGGDTSDADTSGCGVNLPAIDVRGDINTADTKLPDDGKLHFTGVTTSNGGDVIGHIPIGENENVTVKAHVTAKGYGSNLGTHFANYVLTEQFYRAAGGDVTSAVAEASIVSQESAAGLDATIGGDGQTGRTIKITVTGDASDRIVWTASVEVIRDAEKSYER